MSPSAADRFPTREADHSLDSERQGVHKGTFARLRASRGEPGRIHVGVPQGLSMCRILILATAACRMGTGMANSPFLRTGRFCKHIWLCLAYSHLAQYVTPRDAGSRGDAASPGDTGREAVFPTRLAVHRADAAGRRIAARLLPVAHAFQVGAVRRHGDSATKLQRTGLWTGCRLGLAALPCVGGRHLPSRKVTGGIRCKERRIKRGGPEGRVGLSFGSANASGHR